MGKVIAYEIKVLGQEEAIRNAEDLKRVQKAIAEELKRADFGSKKYQELAQEQGKVRVVTKQLRDEVKRSEREFVASGKAAGAAAGSYKALQAQLKQLEDEYFSLGDSAQDAARKLEIKDSIGGLRGRLKEIRSEVGRDGLEGAFSNALSGIRGQFSGLSNFIKGGFIVGAIQSAGQALSQFFSQSTQAFNTQAQAEQSLLVALRGREDVQQRLLQQASEFQGRTLFGDEEIIQAQAFAVSMGLAEDQLGGVIQAAADLSTVTGGTLQDGIKNIVRTFGGLSGELGELVPDIRELTAEELKAGRAVEVLNEAFGGQAEAAAQVGTGGLEQLKNIIGDLGEVFGGLIVRAIEPFRAGLVRLVEGFQDAAQQIPSFLRPVTDAIRNLYEQFENNEALQEFRRLAGEFLVGALRLLVNVIAEAINNITRIASFFGEAANSGTFFGQVLRGLVERVLAFYRVVAQIPDVLSGVVVAWSELGDIIKETFENAVLNTQIALNEIKGLVDSSAREAADALRAQRNEIGNAGGRLAEAFREGYNGAINQEDFEEPQVFFDNLDLSGAGANTDQASRSLQDLTARQTELQNKIKEAILNGQDYQQELRELRNVQSELNQVQETYNRLLGEEKQATEEVRNNGSIAALRAQLAEIDQQIAETTSRERLEALINQRQTVEAGIQALEEQIEQIREESIRAGDDYFDRIAARESELQALRNAAQDQYLEKQKQITDENIAAIELRKQQEIAAILETSATQEEAQAKIEALNKETQLQILGEQLRLQEIGSAEYLEIKNQQAQIEKDIEEEKVNEIIELEQAAKQFFLDQATQISQLLSNIQREAVENSLNAQLAALDEEYQARIDAAEGNAELQTKLEEEKAEKQAQIEKEAAERRKQIAITEAIIQTALAIIEALPDPVATTAAAIAGAIQLATIQAQTFATGGFTGFSSAAPDHTGQRPVGIVHEKEYVVPTKVLQSKQGAAHVRALEALRQRFGYPGAGSGIPAFASGGLTSQVAIPDSALGSLEVVVRLQPEDDFGTMIAEAVQQGAANGSQTGIRSGIREADREREARETLKRKTS